MFVTNPEFQRNLYLKFSVGRLLAPPLVLTLLTLLPFYSYLVLGLLFVVGVLGATRSAAGTVLDEIANRTWDAQRMSALSVWSMTWGKLLGSVSYPWYCLFWIFVSHFLLKWVFLPLPLGSVLQPLPLPPFLEVTGWILAVILFAQSIAFLVGVLFAGVRLHSRLHSREVSTAEGAGIYAGLIVLVFVSWEGGFVTWYGKIILYDAFVGSSILLFSAWGIFCAYRLLCLQLGHRNLPWAFLGFQLFLGCYLLGFLGFPSVSLPSILCVFSIVGVVLFYLALLWDEMSLVQCQRFASAWRRGNWRRTLEELPISVVALLGVLFFALPATLTASLADGAHGWLDPVGILNYQGFQPKWQFPFFLFLVRDAGLFWVFKLRDTSGRGKEWGLLVVFMLHLWPYLLAIYAVDLPSWFLSLSAFLLEAGFSYVSVLVEIFLVGCWLGYAWNRAVAHQLRSGAGRELGTRGVGAGAVGGPG